MRRILAVSAACIVMALPASAATFLFNTTNSGWQNALGPVTVDGITLQSVTASSSAGGLSQVATWAGHGLGVKTNPDCVGGCDGVDHQVDAEGSDDIAYFLFSEAVRIVSITFNYVNTGDKFDLVVDGVQTLTGSTVLSSVAVAATGTQFGIGAADSYVISQTCKRKSGRRVCTDNYFDPAFKITSITVEKLPPPPPPPVVPVPAGGLLLLSGLAGLAALRRR